MIKFQNKVALITGGSRGIGKAISLMFAKTGANIAINYLQNKAAAEEVKKECESIGVKAITFQADMAKRNEVFQMIDDCIKEFGQIDILVNNTGIWEYNPIDSMTEENLKRTIDTNLLGCFYSSSAVTPYMRKQKYGSIIFISSTAGQRGEAFYSPYAASKSGLIGLTKSLAAELVDDNIRVNCVAPGWVETDMSRGALTTEDSEVHLNKILMKRAASPEELAGPVLFLASDMATFITGEVLNVNGGAVLCG